MEDSTSRTKNKSSGRWYILIGTGCLVVGGLIGLVTGFTAGIKEGEHRGRTFAVREITLEGDPTPYLVVENLLEEKTPMVKAYSQGSFEPLEWYSKREIRNLKEKSQAEIDAEVLKYQELRDRILSRE